MASVIVFGSLNMDLTIECDRMPKMGETLTGRGFLMNPGGKGANQAVAAARLGADVKMLGAAGDDVFGDRLASGLQDAGVDCAGLARIPGVPTGVASITRVGSDNCIVLDPGANHVLDAGEAQAALDACAQEGDVLVTQLECDLDATLALMSHAHRKGIFTLFNPAPAVKLPDGVWEDVDLVCLNETECGIITGILPAGDATCRAAMEELRRRGAREVVLTLGAKGSCALTDEGLLKLAPPEVNAVDTTGAGDTYIGALACGRARGMDFFSTAAWASCASAVATTRVGAQQAVPTAAQVAPILETYLENRGRFVTEVPLD